MSNSPTILQKITVPFINLKMFSMLILGYASGFPLMITASSLFIWYKDNGIETKNIAFLTLIAIPYTFKYLWSPLIDRIKIGRFGRRKGWILTTQILLMILIIVMSRMSPSSQPLMVAFIGFLICFTSATQDIAINAYQTEVLSESEKALGSAAYVMGYRIGIIVTGGMTLAILDKLYNDWSITWLLLVLFFSVCPIYTLILLKDSIYQDAPRSLKEASTLPFIEFFKRKGVYTAIVMMIILITYKLGDAIAFSLNSLFFMDLGFSKTTIGISFKLWATIATIAGLFAGGLVARRIGIYKSFLYFSIIMAFANLTYVLLALVGKNYYLMVSSVAVEYFCGGMGTAIFVAMTMSLVNVKFSATQFALLTAIESLGRVFVGPLAGYIQDKHEWEGLFIFSFIVGITTSIIIYLFRNKIKEMGNLE